MSKKTVRTLSLEKLLAGADISSIDLTMLVGMPVTFESKETSETPIAVTSVSHEKFIGEIISVHLTKSGNYVEIELE